MQAVAERIEEMSEAALDYSVHPKFIKASDHLREDIKKLVADGVPTFKMFTIYPGVMFRTKIS